VEGVNSFRRSSRIFGPSSGSASTAVSLRKMDSLSEGSISWSQCNGCTTSIAGRPAQYNRLRAVNLKLISLPIWIGRPRASVWGRYSGGDCVGKAELIGGGNPINEETNLILPKYFLVAGLLVAVGSQRFQLMLGLGGRLRYESPEEWMRRIIQEKSKAIQRILSNFRKIA